LKVEDVGDFFRVLGEALQDRLHVVPCRLGLVLLERNVDNVVKDGAVVPVNVDGRAVQQLEQFWELAKVVVVGKHDTAHEGRLAHRVGAEDVGAGREQQLDDADAAHRARPVQGRVTVVVDDDVRVKVGGRLQEEGGHLSRLGHKVVEDHARVSEGPEALHLLVRRE
jgi:hypothetical protein